MRVAAYRLGAELRHRWRSWLGLVVLVGLASGLVLALVAGARRTQTAHRRLVEHVGDDGLAVFGSDAYGDRAVDVEAAAGVDGVASAYLVHSYSAASIDTSRGPLTDYVSLDVEDVTGTGRRYSKLIDGRWPDPSRPDEAVLHFTVAEASDVGIGDTMTFHLLSAAEFGLLERGTGELSPPAGHPVHVRVVGIDAIPGEFPPRGIGGGLGRVMAMPALLDVLPEDLARFDAAYLELVPGADRERVRAEVARATGSDPAFRSEDETSSRRTDRALRVQAVGFLILAAVSGGALLLILGQALTRVTANDEADADALRAVGLSPGELARSALARVALLGVTGASVGGAVAIAASPLLPVGLARIAEPEPGIDVDTAVLAVGVPAVAFGLCLAAAPGVWRLARRAKTVTRRATPTTDRPTLAGRAAGAGLPPTAVTGLRLALERGRGPTAVPVGTTLVGSALAIGVLVATLTYNAGQAHLASTPRQFGWNWDVMVGNGFGGDLSGLADEVADDPGLAAYSIGTFANGHLSGQPLNVMAMEARRGYVAPMVISGRAPQGDDEILLAPHTMDAIDATIGEEVEVGFANLVSERVGSDARYQVVGTGVVPEVSGVGDPRLGEGAAMTLDGLARIADEPPSTNVLFVDVDADEAGDALADRLIQSGGMLPVKPAEIDNFGRVSYLPVLIAAVIAVLAGGLVLHALVTAIHRRRRDLAVVRALGFVRGQVLSMVAWQASVTIVVGLAVGIPLGIVTGLRMWTWSADDLGVPPERVVPALAILAVAVVGIAVANLAAVVPASRLARVRPAEGLRTE